jgi:rhodanese-related sulfurtransferase
MNDHSVPTLSCQEAKKLLDADEAVLIDVREPDEFLHQHIPGATNIPLSECATVTTKVGTQKTIILQCQGGNRSKQAAQKILAEQEGVTLYSLEGGIVAWNSAGLESQKSPQAILPIMRQVQIAAGSMVFLGTLLGLLFSQEFLILPAFVGAGLVFAGVTGTCGLARALGYMPWNRSL